MPSRIEAAFKRGVVDALGEATKKRVEGDLGIKVESVRTIGAYTLEDSLPEGDLKNISENLFADPIIQDYSFDAPAAAKFNFDFDFILEVGFKPGVTDNVGRTSKAAVQDILRRKLAGDVYTSKQYVLKGKLTRDDCERIAGGLLANSLIERWEITDSASFDRKSMHITIPRVDLHHTPSVREIDLGADDAELLEISKKGVLALSLEEMKKIRDYFSDAKTADERKRLGLSQKPTDCELECLAQTWSEHCKHKIFNALIEYSDEEAGSSETIDSLFKTCIRGSTEIISKKRNFLVSVFTDNAGIIRFSRELNLAMKVETHNSPSALDPYGGAVTGIVGVNRDLLGTGKGAKLLFNTDVFCFASPFYDKPIPARLLHPKRVLEGVRKGVEHGGNKSGIPTVNGCVVFDDRFLGKPLVYCGTGGIMPATINGLPSEEKAAHEGDLILLAGGRTGKDGIHGATFSSEELHEGSPATAVQIGDPITQKKMADFLLEARDEGLYTSITDDGAGGLSSSVGEMAQSCGGAELELEKAPLKYPGLDPWEILISESQERMTLSLPPKNLLRLKELARKHEVEISVVGKFTRTGKFICRYQGKTVLFLDMEFLHKGVPQMRLKAVWKKPDHKKPDFESPQDLAQTLRQLLSRLDICSKEYIVRQYDHEVQAGSAIKPLEGEENDGPSDASVVRPVLGSDAGIVVSNGIIPRYSDIDAYWMAACSIDEAVRNAIATGARPDYLAGLDNFCWCDPVKSEKTPDGEYKLAQLVRANKALYDYTTALLVPCISGKDSMKNDYMIGGTKISIPPTLLFSVIGKIDDVSKAVSIDAKKGGDFVYVLGKTKNELGGTEYFAMNGAIGNNVPKVEFASAALLYNALHSAISKGLVASCHDCSDGGLAVALAETAFSGNLGMEVDLRKVPAEGIERDDFLLFSESASRFIVTVSPKHKQDFEAEMRAGGSGNGNGGIVFAEVGKVSSDEQFVLTGLSGNKIIEVKSRELKDAWQATMKW